MIGHGCTIFYTCISRKKFGSSFSLFTMSFVFIFKVKRLDLICFHIAIKQFNLKRAIFVTGDRDCRYNAGRKIVDHQISAKSLMSLTFIYFCLFLILISLILYCVKTVKSSIAPFFTLSIARPPQTNYMKNIKQIPQKMKFCKVLCIIICDKILEILRNPRSAN